MTDSSLGRRGFLRMAGGLSAAAGLAALPGCSSGGGGAAASRPIRFGAVSSQSGSLAGFGQADAFVFQQVRQELKDGLRVGGSSHPVEILVRDNASDPDRAGEVARDLIESDIDLMVVAGAPETVNPVADACERAGVSCLSSSAPWQPWYFGRQKDPAHPQSFQWTYHFFWGLEDIIRVFGGLWQQVDNDQTIAGLFALNADGDAWADPARGLPGAFKPRGYRFAPVPRFPDLNDNFDAQISSCMGGKADILTGNPQPPGDRGVVATELAVPLVADRPDLRAARRRLHQADLPAVEPAAGPDARRLRGRRGRAAARRGGRLAGDRRRHPLHRHADRRRPSGMGQGPRPAADGGPLAAGRWPVAAGPRLPLRPRARQQRRLPPDPRRQQAPAAGHGLTTRQGVTMLQNLQIRSKLVAILILPLLALAVLASNLAISRISASVEADRLAKITQFGASSLTDVADALQRERAVTNWYVASGHKRNFGTM